MTGWFATFVAGFAFSWNFTERPDLNGNRAVETLGPFGSARFVQQYRNIVFSSGPVGHDYAVVAVDRTGVLAEVACAGPWHG